jgi:hypothetical protein
MLLLQVWTEGNGLPPEQSRGLGETFFGKTASTGTALKRRCLGPGLEISMRLGSSVVALPKCRRS